ncbi:MAG: hypothetical protein V3V50_01780 [Gammaproteobacteria bacterium]
MADPENIVGVALAAKAAPVTFAAEAAPTDFYELIRDSSVFVLMRKLTGSMRIMLDKPGLTLSPDQ